MGLTDARIEILKTQSNKHYRMGLSTTQLEILNALVDKVPIVVYATSDARAPRVTLDGKARNIFRSLRSLRDRSLITYCPEGTPPATASPGQVLGSYRPS